MTPTSSVQDMNASEEKTLGQAFAEERAVSRIWVNEQAGKWARKKLITSNVVWLPRVRKLSSHGGPDTFSFRKSRFREDQMPQ